MKVNEVVVNAYGKTDIGKRNENQDCFVVENIFPKFKQSYFEEGAQINCAPDVLYAACVLDGVACSNDGMMAAHIVKEKFVSLVNESRNSKDSLENIAYMFADKVNSHLISYSKMLREELATTISFVIWRGNKFCAGNIGDSPLYIISDDEVKKISFEHTRAQYRAITGQSFSEKDKHCLINYIGRDGVAGSEMLHIYTGRLSNTDKIALFTDGVTECIDKNSLEESLKKDNAKIVVDSIWNNIEKAKNDNCTAIILNIQPTGTNLGRLSVSQVGSEKGFDEYWKKQFTNIIPWDIYMDVLLKKYIITRKRIGEILNVDLQTAQIWCRQVPPKRETVIKIAVAMGIKDIDEMNEILYNAKFEALYPKALFTDAIWIFIIKHNCWNDKTGKTIDETFNHYYNLAEREIKKCKQKKKDDIETTFLWFKLKNHLFKTEGDINTLFSQYIRELYIDITDVNKKLVSYVEFLLNIQGRRFFTFKSQRTWHRNINTLIKKKMVPSREFLIAFGIVYHLKKNDIDRLLAYAGMRPLHPFDQLEAYLSYALENLQKEKINYFFDGQSKCNNDHLEWEIYNRLDNRKKTFGEMKSYKKLMRLLS